MSSQQNTEARIVEINGKKYCAGLWWHQIVNPSQAKKELRELAKEHQMNLATLYEGMSMLVGFANVHASQRKLFAGSWCLASILMHKIELQSWLGAFDLEDGNVVLVGVSEGRIVPGLDLVTDFEDARRIIEESGRYNQWDRLFITDSRLRMLYEDADYQLEFDERGLKDILTEKKWPSSFRMRPATGGIDPKVMAGGMAVLALGAAWYGWSYYQDMVAEAQLLNQQAQLAQLQQNKKAKEVAEATKLVNERALKPTWPAEPAAQDLLAACRNAALSMPVSVAGWKLEMIECNARSAAGRYGRIEGTTMADFKAAAERLKASKAITGYSVNPGQSRLSANFDLTPRGEELGIPGYSDWSMGWISHFQRYAIAGDLRHRAHPTPKEPEKSLVNILGKEKSVPPPPWWETYEWSFTTDRLNALDLLTPVTGPGLVISKVIITIESPMSWKWTAQGEMHVKQ